MNCNCTNIYKSTSVVVEGGNTYVILPSFTPINRQKVFFVICQSIPAEAINGEQQVFIQIDGSNYPLLDMFGNFVTANKLRTRTLYRGYYGTDNTAHVIVPTFNTKCSCCGN